MSNNHALKASPSGGGCGNVLAAIGLLILTISPIDLIPDIIPVLGQIDDVGYLIGAAAALLASRRRS